MSFCLQSIRPVKNSLQREIHFRSDASRPSKCGLGESREQAGEMLNPAQPNTPGPRPMLCPEWVGGFLFISFLLKALLICLHYLHLSGAPGSY